MTGAASGIGRAIAERLTTDGGHLGLFMGTEALRDHWPVVMAAVLERSAAGADGGRARRAGEAATARERAIPAP